MQRSVAQRLSTPFLTASLMLCATAASAFTVTGVVLDERSQPVQGATVRIRTSATSVMTAPDGSFTLEDLEYENQFATVTASLEGLVIGNTLACFPADEFCSADPVEIVLRDIPPDDPDFRFTSGRPERCAGCHSDGGEIRIVDDFQLSRHANAGKNTWVEARLRDFRTRHPSESGFCADCHIPAAFVGTKVPGASDLNDPNTVDLLDPAYDPNSITSPRRHGVQCLTCHRVTSVAEDSKGFNFAGHATVSRAPDYLNVFGPWDDVADMSPSALPLYTQSLFCAACHEYERPADGPRAAVPGQETFSEWKRWQERLPGDSPLKEVGTCQMCHMPAKQEPGPQIACNQFVQRDPERQPVRNHAFAGTTLGPGVPLPNGKYSMLDGVATLDLQAVQVAADEVELSVQVTNTGAGHKLPTGIDIRNMLVLVDAFDANGQPLSNVTARSSILPHWAGTGTGPEDVAGRPGKGYAKILSRSADEFDDPNELRVEFVEAECLLSDNRIEALESDTSSYVYRLPAARTGSRGTGPVKFVARLVYRRAWADFTERLGLPPTDALGNPLVEHEITRARLSFQPAASFTAPSGTVDLDFEHDAAGIAFVGPAAEADQAFLAYGLYLSSFQGSGPSCNAPDGHVYAVLDGADRVLSPSTSAEHNECVGGGLRLDFSPPVGHVQFDVRAGWPGGGYEVRALDAEGQLLTVQRVYDEPSDCEKHPVASVIPIHLDHHGIAAIEARGVVAASGDENVWWSIRRLSYRFDSAHPSVAGAIATPTPTPTPNPSAPSPTPTSTPAPSQPHFEDVPRVGATVVRVLGALPPGSRVEVRTKNAEGEVVVLGAGTSDENGVATIRLLRPVAGTDKLSALNLRTLEQSVEGFPVSAPALFAALVIGLFASMTRVRRRT